MKTWGEFWEAVGEASHTMRQSDEAVRQLISLMPGRLRITEISPNDLRKLKRELRAFDSRTGKWKDGA